MQILICPDKYRGTATAAAAAQAISDGFPESVSDTVLIPLADGGEGTLDALGGANRVSQVTGPLGDVVSARWRIARGQAVIEMAEASGLLLAGGPNGNDPLSATTSGTGELISEAKASGARRIIIGVGGSASTDGGLGAIRAMEPLVRFGGVDLLVACDVETKFLDPRKALAAFKFSYWNADFSGYPKFISKSTVSMSPACKDQAPQVALQAVWLQSALIYYGDST